MLAVNDALSNWLGEASKRLIGRSLWERLAKVCADWQAPLARVRQSSLPFERLNLKLASEAARGPQWFTLEIARGGQNAFARLSSALPPVTDMEGGKWEEQPGSEGTRREMFARLEGLTQGWPCVIFRQRPDFSMQFASPNIVELTGMEAEEWCSARGRFWEMVHESDAGELQQQLNRAAQTRSAVTNTFRIRHAQTGRVAYILEHRQPATSKDGTLLGYEVLWLDVTRQTIAEKRLSTAAWKETLAVLTLGMTHDFTNIIAGIHSLSESYLSGLEASHRFYEGLTLIKKSSMQASQLVQRMVSLHLGQTGESNYHDLNAVACDLVELVTKILPRRISVSAELAAKQLPVYMDVVEMRQVVINLMLNAADAMPQGGRLTLRTSRHETMPTLENFKGAAPRLPCICLTIQDNGTGIKPRHLASIFDPFFTTKAKGSGLGLYNARLAIEKHHGAISVESQEGAGTSFQLWLPEADFSESDRAQDEARRAHHARRSLLLVGAGGEVLDKTAELLRSHNYHVVIAASTDNLANLLQSGDYHFAGAVLLAQPNDLALNSVPGELRQQNKELKLALKLAGCNQDDLDTQLLSRTDLLLNADLSEAEMLTKLKTLFDQGTQQP
jgi:PAS domain S-box-containing protein